MTTAPIPSGPAASTAEVAPDPTPSEGGGILSGLLLLVPLLAIVVLAGISAAVAAVFSIGFWPALGWTTLTVVGGLLLALGVAILRGK